MVNLWIQGEETTPSCDAIMLMAVAASQESYANESAKSGVCACACVRTCANGCVHVECVCGRVPYEQHLEPIRTVVASAVMILVRAMKNDAQSLCVCAEGNNTFFEAKLGDAAAGARKAELKGGYIKGQWTKEEDEMVMEYVEKYGTKQWARIAQVLPGRKGKQCRERWHNHLNPDINKEVCVCVCVINLGDAADGHDSIILFLQQLSTKGERCC